MQKLASVKNAIAVLMFFSLNVLFSNPFLFAQSAVPPASDNSSPAAGPLTAPKDTEEGNSPETPEDFSTTQNFLAGVDPLSTPSALAVTGPFTVFPGRPVITTFSNQAAVSVDQSSSSQFRVNYDITQPGSFGGAILNFAASPAGPQNLSGITDYQFQFATNNVCPSGTPCLKVEFVDSNGQLAVLSVDGINSDLTPVTLTQDALRQNNGALNFGSIRQINFVVDQDLTSNDAGFYDVVAGGAGIYPRGYRRNDRRHSHTIARSPGYHFFFQWEHHNH